MVIRRNVFQTLRLLSGHRFKPGYCTVCHSLTGFYLKQPWHRDYYCCARCDSTARWRTFVYVMTQQIPHWRDLHVHESSPGGVISEKFASECSHYGASHFFPKIKTGLTYQGFRCENLEAMTFADSLFDLFITQDVLEHVKNPAMAFQEIARVLKPGGWHVFTVPWNRWHPTRSRVEWKNGEQVNLLEPQYHGNPINRQGSLVVTDWGHDMQWLIYQYTGCITSIYSIQRPRLGIEGECLEIFIMQKPQSSD